MAFRFSLDAVLRVRRTIEEREEAILQKIVFEIARIVEDLERVKHRLRESESARLANVLKPSTGLLLRAHYGEVHALKLCRKNLEEKIERLEEAREAQVNVYEAARRDREVLTDMHQKQRTEYELLLSKREQKTLDDNHLARRSR